LRIGLVRRIDLGERRQEAAVIELGEPQRVHHQHVELAVLRADRIALLLGAAGERIDVERHLVAGLLLVRLDGLREAGEPRRLVDDDRDRYDLRRLRMDDTGRQCKYRCTGEDAHSPARLRAP
jgi:hypothetical protein